MVADNVLYRLRKLEYIALLHILSDLYGIFQRLILTHQTVEGASHLETLCNLIKADVICHQNHDIVNVCLHIIHIVYKIQELQYIHVQRFDAISVCRRTFAAFNHPADGAVEETVS